MRYYSGVPGFGGVHAVANPERYEIAISDAEALADAMAEAGEVRPEIVDVRKEFKDNFNTAIFSPNREMKNASPHLNKNSGGKTGSQS